MAVDFGNAGWQRDLSVSNLKIASVLERCGDSKAALHFRAAYDVLEGIKNSGMVLSHNDEEMLGLLQWKLRAPDFAGASTNALAAVSNGGAPAAQSVDLQEVRALLDAGRVEGALQLIHSGRYEPPKMKNAHAVCLMRLGKVDAAVKLLRQLVLPNDALSIEADVPDK